MYYWRGNGKAKREWAAQWHDPATIIGLQQESLWLAHRTTTVKCSKGHVRHATASEQLPLGPMFDALRAPPVPLGRDLQASDDLFMDIDELPLKRSRDTPSSTRQSDFANLNESVQRAQNVGVLLPRTPEQPVQTPETLFTLRLLYTTVVSQRRSDVFDATISMFSRRRESSPVTPRVENSKIAKLATAFSVPVSPPMPSTFAVPSTMLRGFCGCALLHGSRFCTRSRSNAI